MNADENTNARCASFMATGTSCERISAPTWAHGEHLSERNTRKEASLCSVETIPLILLIPPLKDVVGFFGVASEVGAGVIVETWNGEDTVLFEIDLVVERQLKQKDTPELKHSSYDIHTHLRRSYGLVFAINNPAPLRRSPDSVDALPKQICGSGWVTWRCGCEQKWGGGDEKQ